MSGADRQARPWRPRTRESGVAAVEVALLAGVFLLFVFGVIEIARMMYIVNTLQESTRRAAAAASFVSHRDTGALDRIRQKAVFRDSPGYLIFGAPVTDRNIRIDYLALPSNGGAAPLLTPIPTALLPTCPRENRRVCLLNPNAANCIRFVRVQVCENNEEIACNPVDYLSMVPFVALPVGLPKATTITMVESLGSQPEGTPCL
ncbi:TadE/TadG family type IV pilus assembly protein [Massilia sp. ST3]|uniref:TadE/TadG family type IV pilus assembly protein n=1 Tax=Massilia sp. ST3 TaxID=2824903 RepID=UPI001B819925|nr:TadE family protein [Massilia sp. ST3]MBQ5947021.1 pilus assembly protein [Massilia sp. ST3]